MGFPSKSTGLRGHCLFKVEWIVLLIKWHTIVLLAGLTTALVRAEVNWNFLVITVFKITLSTIILSIKLIHVWSVKRWRSPEPILCVFLHGAKSPWPCLCLTDSSAFCLLAFDPSAHSPPAQCCAQANLYLMFRWLLKIQGFYKLVESYW